MHSLLRLLAFANGANDNSKGVATLVGYGAAAPRTALAWAAVTTTMGAAIGALIGGRLVKVFQAGFIGGGRRGRNETDPRRCSITSWRVR